MSFMSTWGYGMNCFLCGMMIQTGDQRFKGLAISERKYWDEKEVQRDHMVPASEVEETDFAKSSTQWTHFFRAGEQTIHPSRTQSCRREMYAEIALVVEGPPDSSLSLTGIGFHDSSVRAVVPASPEQACSVAPSCASHRKRQCKMFRVRDNSLIPVDINYNRLRFGYPVHAHCWTLVDNVIGLEVVKKNLHAFCETMYEYWSDHRGHWHTYVHQGTGPACRYKWRQPGVRQLEAMPPSIWTTRSHAPDSPLRLPKVQKMIQQVERRAEQPSRVGYRASSIVHLPLEFQIMIVDELYVPPDFSRNEVRGVRRALRALGWKLPDQYWISRCSMDLGFDVMEIPNVERVADWGEFCTTLEYSLAGSKWWCASGLALREAILNRLKAVQPRFLERVDCENEAVQLSDAPNGEI
ncbi:hypothetical protein BJX65DRAFT_302047 [Aspergillus insuetus]